MASKGARFWKHNLYMLNIKLVDPDQYCIRLRYKAYCFINTSKFLARFCSIRFRSIKHHDTWPALIWVDSDLNGILQSDFSKVLLYTIIANL